MTGESNTPKERIDIAAPLREVLERMGFTYENVLEVTWEPHRAIVTTLDRNASGIPVVKDGRFLHKTQYVWVTT